MHLYLLIISTHCLFVIILDNLVNRASHVEPVNSATVMSSLSTQLQSCRVVKIIYRDTVTSKIFARILFLQIEVREVSRN